MGTRHMGLRRDVCLLILLTCSAVLAARTPPSLPRDLNQWALASVDCVYREDFDGAFEQTRQIIRKYPDHPAGYFFYAASLDAWMNYHQSGKRENEFYEHCNRAVEKAQALLDKGDGDVWVQFFMGGAEGLKGNYEMRYSRWITAFRYGWRAVTILRKLQEKNRDLADLDYGIGSYAYWRSAMGKTLKWLPGVNDERATGIAQLNRASTHGIYTRPASAAALIDVYFNERMFDSMLVVSSRLLEAYPQSLLFQVGRARALFGLGRLEEAEKQLRILVARIDQAHFDNRYHAVVTRYYLAKTYFEQGQYTSCIAECDGIMKYAMPHEMEQRLTDYLGELKSIQQSAMRESKGSAKSRRSN